MAEISNLQTRNSLAAIRTRFASFERTKTYDLAAAAPVALWWCYQLKKQWPTLDYAIVDTGLYGDTISYLRAISECAVFAFVLFAVIALIVRVPPVEKSPHILPKLAGFFGTFSTMAYWTLPAADITHAMQVTATICVSVGSLAGIYCIVCLGRSFSLLPEARQLKTKGAYRIIRHPLYLAELFTVVGVAIQYVQPWSALIAIGVAAIQIYRIENEEAVLQSAFPQYRAYAARTYKLIPFVY